MQWYHSYTYYKSWTNTCFQYTCFRYSSITTSIINKITSFCRFRLSEEEYEKKGDTLRSFLQRNRLGKYNEEEMSKMKEQQQKELEDEAK